MHASQQTVSAGAQSDPFAGVPEQVQEWLLLPLTSDTFPAGIAFLRDELLPERSRLIVIDRLHSLRRRLAPNDLMRLFFEAYRVARDETQPVTLRSRTVNALATLLVVMQEQRTVARTDMDPLIQFLTNLSENPAEPLAVRGRAIRALGILKARSAAPVLRALLAAPKNIDQPELARNSCLALAQIEGDAAVEPIAAVMATTTIKAIFGTAAFTLGQITTPASLVALVQNEDRFPDSGSPDAALVNMEDLILRMLQQPTDPNSLFAIKATRHLWKDGQRARYTAIMRDTLIRAPLPYQKAAIERLIEGTHALPLRRQQQELSNILPTIAYNPELAAYAQHMRNRMKATAVPGTPYLEPQERYVFAVGNTAAQEYGDAVYHYLYYVGWLRNYNHAGLFAGQSGGVQQTIEADTLIGDTTKNSIFSESFLSHGSDYYGAFQLSNKTLTFGQRKAIMATAQQVADAYIYYTYFSALDPISSARPIAIDNIDNLRCDGVVEYCYEVNGHQSWWHTGYPDRWDISLYPEEHNDAPDVTVNPDTEQSPWSQRGAPADTSEGPGYDGTNPNNAYLTRSAVISLPTYQLSQVRVANTEINVTITATDESGIARMAYMLPGSSDWLYSAWGPQHPDSDSLSVEVSVTNAGALYYYAQDNGGNQPGNPVGINVHGIDSSAGSGGSISPSGSYLVLTGGSVSYVASANANYVVSQWLVDGNVAQTGGNNFALPDVQTNHSVQVTFAYASANLIVNFGAGAGLFRYDGASWQGLSGWSPDKVIPWSGGLAVDFGSAQGLYTYNGTSWKYLTGWDSQNMIKWGNTLVVDFGVGKGLYRYDGASWNQLSGWTAEIVLEWSGGLAVDFGSGKGFFIYDGSYWTYLSSWNPQALARWGDNLIVNFGEGKGMFQYDGTSWTLLSGWTPEGVLEWSGGLAVDFGPGRGLFLYDGASWTHLSIWDPVTIYKWGNDLIVNFGTGRGLFRFNGTSWTLLTGWIPDGVVEWSGGLAVDFGTGRGLFSFSGTSWALLTVWDPLAMIAASFAP